jgi:hypothetical protein
MLVAAFTSAMPMASPAVETAKGQISASDFASLQAAIDANPGGTIVVPSGDHAIDDSLILRHDSTTLCGPGRIVQKNANAAMVRVEDAKNIVVRDVTLARDGASEDTAQAGILVNSCEHVQIENVRVIDNHSYSGSIRLQNSSYCRVENCYILNYKRIGIDDRTRLPDLGYAFQCIDGTGIGVSDCVGTMILNNQIIEQRLLPTRETMERYHLGKLIDGKLPTNFGRLGKWVESAGFAKHWHQGSAIIVSGPEKTTFTRISGNYIENSAQGMDIHSDNFICTENIVNKGMMGMKAMHGSRYGIIAKNIFSRVDNWGIMVGPGTASHAAEREKDGKPARPANSDGTIIISNNVVSDFGRGLEFWNWGGDGPDAASAAVFRFERGQVASNPPLSNVLVEGNMITNSDEELGPDGEAIHPKPRYNYAVLVDEPPANSQDHHYPVNIKIVNNLFVAGQKGLSTVPISSN